MITTFDYRMQTEDNLVMISFSALVRYKYKQAPIEEFASFREMAGRIWNPESRAPPLKKMVAINNIVPRRCSPLVLHIRIVGSVSVEGIKSCYQIPSSSKHQSCKVSA